MLQRIQSIFILFYTGCVFVFLFNDTIDIAVDGIIYTLSAWTITTTGGGCFDCDTQFFPYIIVGILQVASILLASIAFFSYRNRKKQIRLIKICEYLHGIGVMSTIYAVVNTGCLSANSYSISLQIGGAFLYSSIAWLFLARFCIKRDEHLVRASDRLL